MLARIPRMLVLDAYFLTKYLMVKYYFDRFYSVFRQTLNTAAFEKLVNPTE